jgi:cell wall-associated NlpC family hydrolase
MPTSSEFVAYCEAQYGKPYVWGSNGPDSFDCSGLIVSALWELGVLPRGDDRGSAALIEMARAIPVAEGVSTLGALLYRDGHIAVSRGDGSTIEAGSPETGVYHGSATRPSKPWTRAGLLPQLSYTEGNAVRSANQAIQWAKSQIGSRAYRGLCEKFVRSAFGFGPDYGSAKEAWNAAGGKHPRDMNAPPGVPVFWDLTGVNARYGHVALSLGGGLAVSSSDEAGRPGVTIISIAKFTDAYARYLGWAEIYHGVNVYGRGSGRSASPQGSGGTGWYTGLIDGQFGPMTVKALQAALANEHRYLGLIDGQFGRYTVMALQGWLRDQRTYNRAIDGEFGPQTVAALQRSLTARGLYTGLIDGQFGPMTITALQKWMARGK